MKRTAIIWLFVLSLAGSLPESATSQSTIPQGHPTNRSQRGDISIAELSRNFPSPDMIYAPFAFWFWDTALDPDHAGRMAEEMCRKGMNPGYAHPRNGLPRDEWLAPLWFESFGAALEAAETADAYLGYCDEYWWPSGRADGRVLKAHPELKAVSLRCDVFDVEEGDSVELPDAYFTVAARHAGPFVKHAPRPALGQWIWDADTQGEGRTACFRLTLEIPASRKIRSAALAVTADNSFVLYVNGERAGGNPTWTELSDFDLAPLLHSGKNVIAVEAANEDGPCGLVFGLRVDYEDGSHQEAASGEACRTASSPKEGWTEPGFDDTAWKEPVLLGPAGTAPWHLSASTEVHRPAVILSDTLLQISGSSGFEAHSGSWRVYSFTKYHHPGIDGGDVNYIDRRLPEAFIAIAHASYARSFDARMGRSIPGVFVDNEGDYGYKMAWSDDLDREYKAQKGRDIRLWMPLLLDRDAEGLWARARWDWYDVVSEIYTDSFLGSVSRWLGEQGMYCISNLWEESLPAQAFAVGDFFKAQRAVSMPGNDCLVHKALKVHDFKETQSVTEFEACRFQSEVLGVAGWHMTPVLMKQAVNAVIAWGVSHIVPHGVNLNRELNKIPYPPDWFIANPYWSYLHLWTDFARRASYVNSQGHLVPDVLLLNPMDSVWALLGGKVFDADHPVSFGALFEASVDTGEPGPTVKDIDQVYAKAIEDLTAAGIEYLIADRHYLGQMQVTTGGRLIREPFAFKAVVLPSMLVLPLASARKVVAFAEAGGPVYLLGELPTGSTDRGMNDPEMQAIMEKLERLPSVRKAPEGVPGLVADGAPCMQAQVVAASGDATASGDSAASREPSSLLRLHRCIDGRDFFWLANNGDARWKGAVTFRDTRGAASRWNCETGTVTKIPSRRDASGSTVHLTFKPYEAYWVVLDPGEEPLAWQEHEEKSLAALKGLDNPWRVHIDRSVQPPPVGPDPKIPVALLAEEGDLRPLASWLAWELETFTGFVDYETAFVLEAVPGRLVLDLGTVKHMAEVWVNGEPAGSRLWPPFTFEIGGAAQQGRNALKVRVGNLLCNAMKPYGTWGWSRPKAEDFDAGLLGPVVLKQPAGR